MKFSHWYLSERQHTACKVYVGYLHQGSEFCHNRLHHNYLITIENKLAQIMHSVAIYFFAVIR